MGVSFLTEYFRPLFRPFRVRLFPEAFPLATHYGRPAFSYVRALIHTVYYHFLHE